MPESDNNGVPAPKAGMKPAMRVVLAIFLSAGIVVWFVCGMVLVAATGGSEGHVSQKSDSARVVIMGIWMIGVLGGIMGVFQILKPAIKPPAVPEKKEDTNLLK